MSRFYALATYRNMFRERYTLELSGLASQDLSFFLVSQIQYNLSDYYALKTRITHNQGGRETEFGNVPLADIIEISFDVSF